MWQIGALLENKNKYSTTRWTLINHDLCLYFNFYLENSFKISFVFFLDNLNTCFVQIRISKKDFESEVGKMYGGQDKWHHLTCFAKLRSELGYFESGDKLPGFNKLKAKDKDEVKKQLP